MNWRTADGEVNWRAVRAIGAALACAAIGIIGWGYAWTGLVGMSGGRYPGAQPTSVTPVFVKSAYTDCGATLTCAFGPLDTFASGADTLLLVGARTSSASDFIDSVTDNLGNTYTELCTGFDSAVGATRTHWFYTTGAVAGNAAPVINANTSTTVRAVAAQWMGVNASSPFETDIECTKNASQATTQTSGTVTTTGSNRLLACILGFSGTGSGIGPGSSETERQESPPGSSARVQLEEKGAPTAGNYSCSWAISPAEAGSFFAAALQPVSGSIENGYIVFAGATCDMDESTSATNACGTHRRIFSGATSDAASVQVTVDAATTCAGAAYTFTDPTTSTWSAGVEGNRFFAVATNAVAANCHLILKFQALSHISAYSERQTVDITIHDLGGGSPPAPGATYYIKTTGNDALDGLTLATAWLNVDKADNVAPVAGGNVQILISPGTYHTSGSHPTHISPNVGGTDSTHTIDYCANGGDVVLEGPTSGSTAFVNQFDAGVGFVNVNYNCPSANDIITLDGECTNIKNGAPTGCHITQGTSVVGTDLKLCNDHTRTSGWSAFYIGTTANRVTFCGNMGIHGTPFYTLDDLGDSAYFEESIQTGHHFLIDGGTTGTNWDLGGHTTIEGQGGVVTVRNVRMHNSWAAISGFSGTNPDGNRVAVFGSRSGYNWVVHDLLVNRTGKAPDSTSQENFKCEGRRTAIFDSVFRNSHYMFMLATRAGHSYHAEDCHVSHVVFEHGGPIAYIENDECEYGNTAGRIHGYKFKNIVAIDVAQADVLGPGSFSSGNELFVIHPRCGDSYSLANTIQIDGLTVQDSNCSRLGIYYNDNFYTIAAFQSGFPGVLTNYTCTTDANMDNALSAGTDETLANMVSHYTPVSDSLSIDQGVWLTTTTSSGSSSTSLALNDACYFADPVDGTPGMGQSSGGYKVYIQGVGNVAYTARTFTGSFETSTSCRGTLTIPSTSWSNGANVGHQINSGSTPDRGITH